MLGTALLVAFVLAITDEYNTPVHSNVGPVVTGFIVVAIGRAVIGAFAYDGLIRNVLRARGSSPDPEVSEQGRTTVE